MAVWKPFPRQEFALQRNEFEILFGGARGGGKTDTGLVWLTDYIEHPRYRALVIRKNADDLSDWESRAVRFYHGLGANIAYRPPIITFPSGAVIKAGHLKDDQAYTKYQGHEYQRTLIEELTQIPDERRYKMLLASCRSTIPELRPQVFATTNPGGIGHQWVKKRFVDVGPPNTPYIDPETGLTRIYIPATIDDNPILNEVDPSYVKFLDGLKSTDIELWKAWRLGSWDTFAGQFFSEFRKDLHQIKTYLPFKSNVIVAGMDWGRTAPFACEFTEVKIVNWEGIKFFRATTFAEVYGTDKTPREWAELIKQKLKLYNLTITDVSWIRGDPSMFTKGNDKSIAISDQFTREGIRIKKGSNDRVGGWTNMHSWLSIAPDGLPYWQISENCPDLLFELPALVHDELKVEDVDTAGVDHASDAIRYMFKSLKWIDAKAGAVSRPITIPMGKTAEFIGDKQISVDLRQFESTQVPYKTDNVGAVIHW